MTDSHGAIIYSTSQVDNRVFDPRQRRCCQRFTGLTRACSGI